MPENNNLQKEQTSLDQTSDTVSEKKSSHKSHANKTISLLQITGWFFITLLLISIAAGYFLWQFVNETKDTIELNISNNKTEVSSLADGLTNSESNLKEQINTLTNLQSELSNSVEALLSQSTHMRKDWLVSEAEYLVKLAVNRLTLEGDIKTAITALTNADARLLEAGDPGLLLLRQEISNKLIALKALPIIDISDISIKINSVIHQIDQLPLVTPDPESIKYSQQKTDSENIEDTPISWTEVTSKVISDLSNLVRIRKHDQKVQPLLTPEQRFYLIQNLKLQLEQARTALLHQQETIFRERLTQAISWIQEYFDNSKKSTQSAIEILSNLNQIKLIQDTPDLSYALKMFINFQAGIRLKKKTKSIKKKKVTPKKKTTVKTTPKKQKPVETKKVPTTKTKPVDPIIEPPKTSIPKESPSKKSSEQETIKKDNDKTMPVTPAKPGISL